MLPQLGTILEEQNKQNARLREEVQALEILVIAFHGEELQEEGKEAMGADMGAESLLDAFRRQDRERNCLIIRLSQAMGKLNGTEPKMACGATLGGC